MRYELKTLSEGLGSDFNLDDEISLVRMTIQDLVTFLEQQPRPDQRIAVGSLLRGAVEDLSRIIERAARLPLSPTAISVDKVAKMLNTVQQAIVEHLPDGVARQQLIMNVKHQLAGISIRDEPQALILRTCEMMDQSVPRVH